MTKVTLERIDDSFHFEAVGSTGVPVSIDAAPKIGGHDKGARPMELLLMGLGGCSAIDIIDILKKQKQTIKQFQIVIEAERLTDQLPAIFKTIHIFYKLKGELNESFVERAINLSMEKYCSASAIIGKTAKITHSFEIMA